MATFYNSHYESHATPSEAQPQQKNAMANPRKFSEKIALIRAKEAEQDAAFHRILNEVSGITKDPIPQQQPGVPPGPPYASFKGGSLPNINYSLQLQQQQQQQQQPQHPEHGSIDLKSAIYDLSALNSAGDVNRGRRMMPPQYVNLPPRPPPTLRAQHTPYSPYLSPQPLNGHDWKKFKSDSDIHGSMKQQPPPPPGGSGDNVLSSVVSPMIHRRVLEVQSPNGPIPRDLRMFGGDRRPKSCSDFPPHGFIENGMEGGVLAPQFSLHGPPDMNMPQPHPMFSSLPHPIVPNNNHHGSLPDLSNLGFGPPQAHMPGGPMMGVPGRFVNTGMPPPDSPSMLPGGEEHPHSPMDNRFHHFPQQPFSPGSNSPHIHMQTGGEMPPSPTHLSLEKQMVNETIRRRISDKLQRQQHYRRTSESCSSPTSPNNTTPVRSPEPSPHNLSNVSSPCAPESLYSEGGYFSQGGSNNTRLLQHKFEQFKVDNMIASTGNMNFPTNGSVPLYTQSQVYMDSSDHMRHPIKTQCSIPDIILTGAEDMRPDFAKDLSLAGAHASSDSLENDMFSHDEHFKTDLTPLDLEGLQMLEDPSSILTDPNTEEQLRLCGSFSS